MVQRRPEDSAGPPMVSSWKAQAPQHRAKHHTQHLCDDVPACFLGHSGHGLMPRAADTSDLRENLSTHTVFHPSTYKKVWCGHELTGRWRCTELERAA